VPSLQLTAEPLLGGFKATFDDTDLSELTTLAIVSIAIPLGGDKAFASALNKAYGASIPPAGGSSLSANGNIRFLWMARDQLFALFEEDSPNAAADMSKALSDTAYVTLQSDNWVVLRLAGSKARDALERICPLDLHPSAFAEGHAARTIMEHMGAILVHETADQFLLLSASSTAKSYLHAVQTSLHNVT